MFIIDIESNRTYEGECLFNSGRIIIIKLKGGEIKSFANVCNMNTVGGCWSGEEFKALSE